ncbi:hypothetical protein BZA05DRAFT_152083 [Tricharina praecox]|uniref:uncharacterized protein n=1 Tax=Tricharina praecox TaxID=43433 RepID=UPI00221F73FC|nr:uncharacterized protein BZA05DRAFT_152083 [Tricharina praecox]KAI5844851.1 hypothetical protein BZA05DRAFT_152083 [Tricharina praecox]
MQLAIILRPCSVTLCHALMCMSIPREGARLRGRPYSIPSMRRCAEYDQVPFYVLTLFASGVCPRHDSVHSARSIWALCFYLPVKSTLPTLAVLSPSSTSPAPTSNRIRLLQGQTAEHSSASLDSGAH